MKRLICIICALMLLCAFVIPALAVNYEGSMYVYTKNGKALRFRTSRSTTEDNVICQIPVGTKVFVLGTNGSWAKIKYNGITGWVMKGYLSPSRVDPNERSIVTKAPAAKTEKPSKQTAKPADSPTATPAPASKINTKVSKVVDVEEYDVTVYPLPGEETAAIHKTPSVSAKVLVSCGEGYRLVVRGEGEGWARVYDGATDLTGYMLLDELVPDEEEEIELD